MRGYYVRNPETGDYELASTVVPEQVREDPQPGCLSRHDRLPWVLFDPFGAPIIPMLRWARISPEVDWQWEANASFDVCIKNAYGKYRAVAIAKALIGVFFYRLRPAWIDKQLKVNTVVSLPARLWDWLECWW